MVLGCVTYVVGGCIVCCWDRVLCGVVGSCALLCVGCALATHWWGWCCSVLLVCMLHGHDRGGADMVYDVSSSCVWAAL